MGLKKALIPLTALAILGTGCAGAPQAPEEEAIVTMANPGFRHMESLRERYYPKAKLVFEGDINGDHVRMYEELDTYKSWKGHMYTFLEVERPDGTLIAYGDDWLWDRELEWVAIPENGEMRLYEDNEITIIKDGKQTKLSLHEDVGALIIEEGQAQFDVYVSVIDGIEEQQKQDYYEETLKPLQEWALDALASEPGPLPQELPRPIHEKYLANADLVFNEVVDGERVRLYEKTESRNIKRIIILVDRQDGISFFYEDWKVSGYLDTVAITEDGITQFYEPHVLEVYQNGQSERLHELHIGKPIHTEALPLFKDYLKMIYSQIGTYEERNPNEALQMQQEALDALRGY